MVSMGVSASDEIQHPNLSENPGGHPSGHHTSGHKSKNHSGGHQGKNHFHNWHDHRHHSLHDHYYNSVYYADYEWVFNPVTKVWDWTRMPIIKEKKSAVEQSIVETVAPVSYIPTPLATTPVSYVPTPVVTTPISPIAADGSSDAGKMGNMAEKMDNTIRKMGNTTGKMGNTTGKIGGNGYCDQKNRWRNGYCDQKD